MILTTALIVIGVLCAIMLIIAGVAFIDHRRRRMKLRSDRSEEYKRAYPSTTHEALNTDQNKPTVIYY